MHNFHNVPLCKPQNWYPSVDSVGLTNRGTRKMRKHALANEGARLLIHSGAPPSGQPEWRDARGYSKRPGK